VQHDNAAIHEFDTSCFSGEYITSDITAEYLRKVEAARSDGKKLALARRVTDSPDPIEIL
jgi:amidophosphoribosyltransferase